MKGLTLPDEQKRRLQSRLDDVNQRLGRIGPAPFGSGASREFSELIGSRDQIELALAQLDVAESQREASAAQRDLASAENRRAQASEDERASRDDDAFWSRRFYTSLAVGNGVGFLTIASALIQAGKVGLTVVLGFAPLMYFACGVGAAGAIPWLIWRQRASPSASRWQPPLRILIILATTLSAGFFVLGLGSAAVEVWQLNPVAAKAAEADAKVNFHVISPPGSPAAGRH
jgi:hypothetical protein